MKILKNIASTLAVLLAINGVAEKLIKDRTANNKEKSNHEIFKVKEKPEAKEHSPVCSGGSGGGGGA